MIDFIFHTVEVIGSNPIAPTIESHLQDVVASDLAPLGSNKPATAVCALRFAGPLLGRTDCPYRKFHPTEERKWRNRWTRRNEIGRLLSALLGSTKSVPYRAKRRSAGELLIRSDAARRLVVHSGGEVRRPVVPPRLAPFPLAESVVARANPLLRGDGFGICDSSPNTNEACGVGRLR